MTIMTSVELRSYGDGVEEKGRWFSSCCVALFLVMGRFIQSVDSLEQRIRKANRPP